jgi:hypothetical protein
MPNEILPARELLARHGRKVRWQWRGRHRRAEGRHRLVVT